MKIALTTTFPYSAFDIYAARFLQSLNTNWPRDMFTMIQLDQSENQEKKARAREHCQELMRDFQAIGISDAFDDDQKQWLKQFDGQQEPDNYRLKYKRFSYKVFTIAKAAEFCSQNEVEYLLWLDADTEIKQPVTHEIIQQWLPGEGELVSYFGRKDYEHSECGFMAFKLPEALPFIQEMRQWYIENKVLTLPQWHDSFVFDRLRENYEAEGAKFRNLTADANGMDVFEQSPLGPYITHYKGPVAKHKLIQGNASHGSIAIENLHIKTKNCVDHALILKQIEANMGKFKKWLPLGKQNDEEIVIASAGPSFAGYELKPYYEKGTKIVAVKHSLDRLQRHGITPWACMLLDPRQHVADFVTKPNKDILYFVASMVNPEVVDRLLDADCKVYGYHAMVGAGEEKIIPEGQLAFAGGSATATRSISVLQALGFRKFHLYGYDCCYFEKPDFTKKGSDGKDKYFEVNLDTTTWGGEQVTRTWWTEGQFLAQIQEMQQFYKLQTELTIDVYGEGIIPWLWRHNALLQSWIKKKGEKQRREQARAKDINEIIPECHMVYQL